MVAAETDHWRNTLRNIAWDAEDAGQTLQFALKAFSRAKYESTGDGVKVLTQASGAGRAAGYTLPPGTSVTEITAQASRFIDLYEEVVAALDSAGEEDPTDAEILTEMLDRLFAVRVAISDFSQLAEPIPLTQAEVGV